MFYHASPVKGIETLEPRISNHGIPQIYFSTRRENVLVYLSNAVEKHCKSVDYSHTGSYYKWASYGFTAEGLLRVEEYYPNATEDTYRGVSGWIYSLQELEQGEAMKDIPFAYTSRVPVKVEAVEFIPDAYEAILQAEREGKLVIKRYETASEANLQWIARTIPQEYDEAADRPEYQLFLKAKFPEILKNK